jgi:uncharacterized protein
MVVMTTASGAHLRPATDQGAIVTCTTCGADIPSAATTCPTCGAPAAGGPPPQPAGAAGYGTPPPERGDYPPPGRGAYQASTHPSGLSNETRNWALAAHLSAFVGAWLLLAFIGPLIVWMTKRDDHPFIDHHAKEALNFNLSLILYGVLLAILAIPIGLVTLGLGLIPLVLVGAALAIGWLVLTIVAAVNAANGEAYRYPITIRFVR